MRCVSLADRAPDSGLSTFRAGLGTRSHVVPAVMAMQPQHHAVQALAAAIAARKPAAMAASQHRWIATAVDKYRTPVRGVKDVPDHVSNCGAMPRAACRRSSAMQSMRGGRALIRSGSSRSSVAPFRRVMVALQRRRRRPEDYRKVALVGATDSGRAESQKPAVCLSDPSCSSSTTIKPVAAWA